MNYQWYQTLIKPSFAPPAWVFGPAWTFLYTLIAISFGYSFYKIAKKQFPARVALPLGINLISNALFTPIQFGLRNNLLATVDIVIVWLSIFWIMKAIWPHKKWVVYMQIPYLLWVTFASIVQFSVTYLNW